jgi:hypothetical protein
MCDFRASSVAECHAEFGGFLGFKVVVVLEIGGLTEGVGFCKSMQTNNRDHNEALLSREKGGEAGAGRG